MADFMAALTSNSPRVKDPQGALAVINRYHFDYDASVEISADRADEQQKYLTLYGDGWPEAWKIPPGVDTDDFEPDYDADSGEGFEEFLKDVAPYLAEPLTVQAVGHTKCRFPFSACEWHVRPGNGKVEISGFKHCCDQPIIVEESPLPNTNQEGSSVVTVKVSDVEFHTILAALRYYQEHDQTNPAHRSEWIEDLATNGGEVIPLSADAIDQLCQRINCESV